MLIGLLLLPLSSIIKADSICGDGYECEYCISCVEVNDRPEYGMKDGIFDYNFTFLDPIPFDDWAEQTLLYKLFYNDIDISDMLNIYYTWMANDTIAKINLDFIVPRNGQYKFYFVIMDEILEYEYTEHNYTLVLADYSIFYDFHDMALSGWDINRYIRNDWLVINITTTFLTQGTFILIDPRIGYQATGNWGEASDNAIGQNVTIPSNINGWIDSISLYVDNADVGDKLKVALYTHDSGKKYNYYCESSPIVYSLSTYHTTPRWDNFTFDAADREPIRSGYTYLVVLIGKEGPGSVDGIDIQYGSLTGYNIVYNALLTYNDMWASSINMPSTLVNKWFSMYLYYTNATVPVITIHPSIETGVSNPKLNFSFYDGFFNKASFDENTTVTIYAVTGNNEIGGIGVTYGGYGYEALQVLSAYPITRHRQWYQFYFPNDNISEGYYWINVTATYQQFPTIKGYKNLSLYHDFSVNLGDGWLDLSEAVSFDESQFFIIILFALWTFLITKGLESRKIGLAYTQFIVMIPLFIITIAEGYFSGFVYAYLFGFAILISSIYVVFLGLVWKLND